jgi:CRISPR system Cascade subunit CasC
MFIELHTLQNFAPSNLNRDDNNMPKDAVFGGVRRARVSSQAWKRPIRKSEIFRDTATGSPAMLTKMLVTQIKKYLDRPDTPQEVDVIVTEFVKTFVGRDLDSPPKGEETTDRATSQPLSVGEDEVKDMAHILNAHWEKFLKGIAQREAKKATSSPAASSSNSGRSKKGDDVFADTLKESLDAFNEKWTHKDIKDRSVVGSPEVALFGRMLAAEGNNQSIEAACQVAHAISTHRVDMEMDFFTAMDDCLPSGAQGAAMLGQTDFNASCYYRYARLDWQILVDNLNGNSQLARNAVKGFLLAFAQVVPSGKQKPFAALNPPDFALAVVRNRGMGWSLANAFEEAVPHKAEGGYLSASVKALDSFYGWMKRAYDNPEQTTVKGEWLLRNPKHVVDVLKADKAKANLHEIANLYEWAEKITFDLTGIPDETKERQ